MNYLLWGIVGVLAFGGVFFGGDVGALTYSSDADVEFTFNPTIGVSLSSNLRIDDLAPGSTSDSNIITVSVNTNTANGYTLNATVGQATNYETRNLVLDGNNSYNFTSINYGASLTSLTTDNTWGYAYLPSTSGASWTRYSGLPLYSDTTHVATLISTNEAADNDSVQFKIAAKASNAMASGEYKNVINFIAVANALVYNYSILYYDESGEAEGMPSSEFGTTSDDYAFVSDQEPTRTNYDFNGWCDDYDYLYGESTCSGNMYYPGDIISFDETNFYIGLTAIWVWNPEPGYCSQNPDDPECSDPDDPCDLDPESPECNGSNVGILFDEVNAKWLTKVLLV